jgi:hypothetical protein
MQHRDRDIVSRRIAAVGISFFSQGSMHVPKLSGIGSISRLGSDSLRPTYLIFFARPRSPLDSQLGFFSQDAE